jgi:hypothetical protein
MGVEMFEGIRGTFSCLTLATTSFVFGCSNDSTPADKNNFLDSEISKVSKGDAQAVVNTPPDVELGSNLYTSSDLNQSSQAEAVNSAASQIQQAKPFESNKAADIPVQQVDYNKLLQASGDVLKNVFQVSKDNSNSGIQNNAEKDRKHIEENLSNSNLNPTKDFKITNVELTSLLNKDHIIFKDGSKLTLNAEKMDSTERLVINTLNFMNEKMNCRFIISGVDESAPIQNAEKLTIVVAPPDSVLFNGVKSVEIKISDMTAKTFKQAVIHLFGRLVYGNGYDTGTVPFTNNEFGITELYKNGLKTNNVNANKIFASMNFKVLNLLKSSEALLSKSDTESFKQYSLFTRDAWASYVIFSEYSNTQEKQLKNKDLVNLAKKLDGDWSRHINIIARPDEAIKTHNRFLSVLPAN